MAKGTGLGTTWVGWTIKCAAVLAVVLGLMLAAEPAHAKTFTVTSKQDFSDIAPGDGICDTLSASLNPCTLRGAIQEANSYPGADAIHFDIPLGGVKTIQPESQLPAVATPITIDGYTQPGATENTLEKGTNASLRIELDGTEAQGSSADGLLVTASNSVIRGLVINRFANEGIQLNGSNNKVEGNFVGTESSGLGPSVAPMDPGNLLSGVLITSAASGNTVGGTAPAARNIVAANGGAGVRVSGQDNSVQGNLLGAAKDGTPLVNLRSGVEIFEAGGNIVGGNTPEASNTMICNGGGSFYNVNGVTVTGTSSTGNRILRNSIANADLGIDLSNDESFGDGATPNDAKDPDTGANGLQNFPVLTSATSSGGEVTVEGKLNSKPNKTYVVRFFFSSDQAPNVGSQYKGQKSVTTNANGNVSFTFSSAQAVPPGSITATATDPNGNTSEFSKARSVTRG